MNSDNDLKQKVLAQFVAFCNKKRSAAFRREKIERSAHYKYFRNIEGYVYINLNGTDCRVDLSTTRFVPILESRYRGKKYLHEGVYALEARHKEYSAQITLFAVLIPNELYGQIIHDWYNKKLKL